MIPTLPLSQQEKQKDTMRAALQAGAKAAGTDDDYAAAYAAFIESLGAAIGGENGAATANGVFRCPSPAEPTTVRAREG